VRWWRKLKEGEKMGGEKVWRRWAILGLDGKWWYRKVVGLREMVAGEPGRYSDGMRRF
jgi:hypothetical protein